MRNLIAMACIIGMAGCTTTPLKDYAKSRAQLNNLKIVELGKAGTDQHQLDVSFAYDIRDFHEKPGLYTCSVLFVRNENEMFTRFDSMDQCQINQQQGKIAMQWDTPFSDNADYTAEERQALDMPLKYHVVIHQKTSKTKNVVIGMSQAQYITAD